MFYGALKRFVSYRFVHILSFTDFLTWQKMMNDAEICHTYGRFLFVFLIKLHTSVQEFY